MITAIMMYLLTLRISFILMEKSINYFLYFFIFSEISCMPKHLKENPDANFKIKYRSFERKPYLFLGELITCSFSFL